MRGRILCALSFYFVFRETRNCVHRSVYTAGMTEPNSTSQSQPINIVPVLKGVADTSPSLSKAEAALLERVKSGDVRKTYTIKGVAYKLQPVLPAIVFKHFSSLQNQEYDKAIELFVTLFDPEDADAVRAVILDQSTDMPLDIDYLNDAIQEVMEIVSDRPLDKP